MMTCLILWLVLLLPAYTNANVEKLIFISPPSSSHRNLDLNLLPTLTPDRTNIRTQFLSRHNHTPSEPQVVPSETWFLLSNLRPDRRHEVRICWPATQPTTFELELFTEHEIAQRQELLLSIPKLQNPSQRTNSQQGVSDQEESRLLFKVKAVADYFTANRTLMSVGVIVDVDIILDEYIWNLAPRSLASTGVYLLVTAIIAIFIARKVLVYLESVASADHTAKEIKDKKRL